MNRVRFGRLCVLCLAAALFFLFCSPVQALIEDPDKLPSSAGIGLVYPFGAHFTWDLPLKEKQSLLLNLGAPTCELILVQHLGELKSESVWFYRGLGLAYTLFPYTEEYHTALDRSFAAGLLGIRYEDGYLNLYAELCGIANHRLIYFMGRAGVRFDIMHAPAFWFPPMYG